MHLIRLGALSLAAAGLAIGTAPAMARPHHDKPHKVCKTSWHHHHRVTHCHWERR